MWGNPKSRNIRRENGFVISYFEVHTCTSYYHHTLLVGPSTSSTEAATTGPSSLNNKQRTHYSTDPVPTTVASRHPFSSSHWPCISFLTKHETVDVESKRFPGESCATVSCNTFKCVVLAMERLLPDTDDTCAACSFLFSFLCVAVFFFFTKKLLGTLSLAVVWQVAPFQLDTRSRRINMSKNGTEDAKLPKRASRSTKPWQPICFFMW
jgi:hypothetical protein